MYENLDPILKELLVAFELHSVENIEAALDAGIDPTQPIQDKLPVDWLTEMYTRSDRFPDCLRLLLDRGAELPDPRIEPLLLDNVRAIGEDARADPGWIEHRTTVTCAFSPLVGATPLHVAAEYGHLDAARELLALGADVEARAATDPHGLDGTPDFSHRELRLQPLGASHAPAC